MINVHYYYYYQYHHTDLSRFSFISIHIKVHFRPPPLHIYLYMKQRLLGCCVSHKSSYVFFHSFLGYFLFTQIRKKKYLRTFIINLCLFRKCAPGFVCHPFLIFELTIDFSKFKKIFRGRKKKFKNNRACKSAQL